jgi:hypothetical protein
LESFEILFSGIFWDLFGSWWDAVAAIINSTGWKGPSSVVEVEENEAKEHICDSASQSARPGTYGNFLVLWDLLESFGILWNLFESFGICLDLWGSWDQVIQMWPQHMPNIRMLGSWSGLIVVIGIKQASYQSLDNGVASDWVIIGTPHWLDKIA